MRVAHLSDLHLLSESQRSRSLAAKFVSLMRPLDIRGRIEKTTRALAEAHAQGAAHVVISGDLTEVGAPAEFETLAAVLANSPFAPEQITLVPGNHDAYTARDGWRRALEGPLAPYRTRSVSSPASATVVDLGSLVLLAVDTTRYQSVASSFGVFTRETRDSLAGHLARSRALRAPRVLIQHHPPFPRKSAAWQYIDGLQGWGDLYDLLLDHPRMALLHGHMHLALTRALGDRPEPRVFGAAATVDDRAAPRLRLYEVQDDLLRSVDP